ncbi:MAG: hypothetical protein ACP5G2_02685 [Candidatus Bipolaricaulaceae bacterium]
MYTVAELIRLLGLTTANQVRNRIEAVRDLLVADIRRGPNNQMLITDQGLATLRSLQDLCERGHTLKEAANILRYDADKSAVMDDQIATKTGTNPDSGWVQLVEHLAGEVRELQRRISDLERAVLHRGGQAPWWTQWAGGQ